MQNKTYIIAEAGINHNGSIDIAKEMIVQARNAGADAVKFQAYITEEIVSQDAPKAAYQKNHLSESHYEMLKKCEMSISSFKKLKYECERCNIDFLLSIFDIKSLELVSTLNLKTYKIPSGEITDIPYLKKVGTLRKNVILSTGMSTIEEINKALLLLEISGTLKKNITVLHCNTEYPTPFKDANLNAMVSIKNKFNVNVGYSDHTNGSEASIAAVVLGAEIIEKHFTLDKDALGPDHKASLLPSEFAQLVNGIRNVEVALGTGKILVSPSEEKNKIIARKSIVASKRIVKGELFSEHNLTTKRPETAISAFFWDDVLGKKADKTFEIGDMIEVLF